MVYRCLIALAEPGSGGRSLELTRHVKYLARLSERNGFAPVPLKRFGSVTDEVPVRGLPHMAGPPATAQPSRADRAAASVVRLVLDEKFAPSVGDGLDMPACQ